MYAPKKLAKALRLRCSGSRLHPAAFVLQMAVLSADAVAQLLADPATRVETLGALEQHQGVHDKPLALAAASALTNLVLLPAAEVPDAVLRRAGLLRGRLMTETDDVASMCAAMHGNGRMAIELRDAENAASSAVSKPATALTRDDAYTCACVNAYLAPSMSTGWTAPAAAYGMASESDDGTAEYVQVVMAQYHGGGQYHPVFLDDDWMVRHGHLAAPTAATPQAMAAVAGAE